MSGPARRDKGQRYKPLGHDYFHAIVDDHSRLVYGELLADEKGVTVLAFTERALAWFAARGITARRVMTDGAMSYQQPRLSHPAGRARHPAHHHAALHPPLERQGRALPPDHGTRMGQGPALPQQHRQKPGIATLATALQRAQTHSSLGGQPPISRAHNLSGHDS
jgi:hypothetical protein